MDASLLPPWLAGFMDQPGLLLLGLFAMTFLLEDAATLAAVFLSLEGILDPVFAWAALVAGIALSDIGLYALGRLGRKSRRVLRWLEAHRWVRKGTAWIHRNLIVTTIMARGIPGTRLPTYVGIGLLGVRAMRFAAVLVVAVLLWTSLIFGTAFFFSAWIEELMGPVWRTAFVLVLFVLLFLLPRLIGKLFTARADG